MAMIAGEIVRERLSTDEPTVVHRLDTLARAQPDRPFLFYGEDERRFTYREFDRLTNRVANSLAALGIGQGDRVAVLSTNGLVSAVSMFAAWKTGALYCPVNYRFVGDLLAYVIDDLAPVVLIADRHLVPALNDCRRKLTTGVPRAIVHAPARDEADFDAQTEQALPHAEFRSMLFSELRAAGATRPGTTVKTGDLCSVVYTSGTTGNPKGVIHPHGWLRAFGIALATMTHRDDVLYCDLPLYHIGGAYANLVRAAWAGASIAVWNRFSPADFWRRIHASGASITLLLDVMNDWLMQQPEHPGDRENPIVRAHVQPLPANHQALAQTLRLRFPRCRLRFHGTRARRHGADRRARRCSGHAGPPLEGLRQTGNPRHRSGHGGRARDPRRLEARAGRIHGQVGGCLRTGRGRPGRRTRAGRRARQAHDAAGAVRHPVSGGT